MQMKTTQVKKMMAYTSTRHVSRCKGPPQTSSTNATEDTAADNPSGNSVAAETSANSIPPEATARKCPYCQVDFPASYFFHHLRSCNTRRRPQAFLSETEYSDNSEEDTAENREADDSESDDSDDHDVTLAAVEAEVSELESSVFVSPPPPPNSRTSRPQLGGQ